MVDCYCGCDTRGNRIKFAISGTLYVLGAVILLWASHALSICNNPASQECMIISVNGDDEAYAKYHCEEVNEQLMDCVQSPAYTRASMAALFAELLMILATVPLCVLCCCTKKPQQEALIQAPTALHQGAHYDRI